MPAEITMPKLGLTMETGTIVRWLKGPGERIVVGDPLLEVSTDKINYEVESPVGGTLTQHLGNDGEEFACGAVIGLVALDDEHVTLAASASPVSVGAPRAEPASLPPPSGTPAGNGSRKAAATGSRRPASPAARKLARELHVDVATVSGSGPRGRVTLSDVLAVAPAATSEPRAQPGTAALPPDLDRARRTIFRRMSDVGILPLAQVETSVRVDELRALMKRRDDFGWTAFAVCALARLLREHPL
ncbi:MAG TPA: E3 binding domain-containing protein, partial [Candidatus Baltobacteraceae bacterium]|nr:E3 binding domain-containing protein [Candidatus Baltobacteraceae bacterium]